MQTFRNGDSYRLGDGFPGVGARSKILEFRQDGETVPRDQREAVRGWASGRVMEDVII